MDLFWCKSIYENLRMSLIKGIKMKKLILAVLLSGLFTGSVLAEKVTYDQAVESTKAYQDAMNKIDQGTATEGLSASESGGEGGTNQLGRWVNVGSSSLDNAGQYSLILAPNSQGKSCVKGDKGWISKTVSECVSSSSSGFCRDSINIIDTDNGFKAECR